MATPKKKHLIELMIEAGVKWPDGAEYAAQDKFNFCVNFYGAESKPNYRTGGDSWCDDNESWLGSAYGVILPSLCRNWHQTIVTREQYEEALADAETWNAWIDTSHPEEKPNQTRESESYPAVAHAGCFSWNDATSIEQPTSEYHAKAAEAQRLQAVADEALNEADDALIALEKAGEAIGLIISVGAKAEKIAPTAAWKVGDECVVTESPDDSDWVGRQCKISKIDESDDQLKYRVIDYDTAEFWVKSIKMP